MGNRWFRGVHATLGAAVLCLVGQVGAQQPAPRNLLVRTACAAEVYCPASWISQGVTPKKVQAVLGLDVAAARRRLREAGALWSDAAWACAALGQGCSPGMTQRQAQIMIPLDLEGQRAVQQALTGSAPLPLPEPAAAVAAPSAKVKPMASPVSQAAQQQGSAACFNPDLFKAGTRYRRHSRQQHPNGDVAHVIWDISIEESGSFAGAHGLIVERGTFALTSDPAKAHPNPITEYFSLEQTPDGPVYYRHGGTQLHESTAMRGRPAKESETVYIPPVKFAQFAMQPGQSYSFVGSSSDTSREPGKLASPAEHRPDSQKREVSYVGRKQLSTPLGTFDTCHFVVNGSDHHYIVGMGLPLRLGKAELQADSHVNGVPLSAWAR